MLLINNQYETRNRKVMKTLSITHSVLPSGVTVSYEQAVKEPRPLKINTWYQYIHKQSKKKTA
jgi:hypothetical protein